ncbi:MAG: ATP-grasp domain-containing protein [Clostridium sp.]|uniref:ATP-grasp domain-containing protein n=1 Tax=Clostridium sp. TaxID=1506 RepID=UPI003F2BEB60
MKKILFLGGSKQQVPAIEYAKSKGYYTILCDFLSDNPGQFVADKFYCESTTDLDKMLEISMENKINGIVAYASDPAALTAAYVGNKMGLKSNPYESVEILSKKNLFRKFLNENGFNCPKAKSFKSFSEIKNNLDHFKFPVMVKPIDSCGSKGVSRANNIDEIKNMFKIALDNSREKNVIIEEFIQRDHEYMISGDAFVIDGEVVYFGLLNGHRDRNVNEFVPIGNSYPTFLSKERIQKVKNEVQKVMNILRMDNGALNLELMFDEKDQIYIIEIGPRNGGNMIPKLLSEANKVDLVGATVENAMDNLKELKFDESKKKFVIAYVLHSGKDGIFNGINYLNGIEKNIKKKVMYKNIGEEIKVFNGANEALGIIFLEFDSLEDMKEFVYENNKFIEVSVC